MNRIEQFYNGNPQYEWGRLERHRVEYGLTLRALEEHLPAPPAEVVDIGGSVGRYAIELTRRGYAVTLVDVSGKCLAFAREKADEAGVALAGFIQADVRDLSGIAEENYDAALLMGPLYHLLEHPQRLQAVGEARRVLRPGGLVFAAFICIYAVVKYALATCPEYIVSRREEWESIRETGVFRRPEGSEGFIDAWFARPRDIPPLMAEGGFEQWDFLGCEVLATELEDKINQADDELHRQWIDLLYSLSRDPCILGGSAHLLYVGKKGP